MKRWLQTYAYWNAGGLDNVAVMLCELGKELGGLEPAYPSGSSAAAVLEEEEENPLVKLFQSVVSYFTTLFGGEEPISQDEMTQVGLALKGIALKGVHVLIRDPNHYLNPISQAMNHKPWTINHKQ